MIAASAGNHGQALAYAATRAGIKATIVMPRTAAIAKIDATRSYGQQVMLEGADYQEARPPRWSLGERTGAVFVDAYDDPYVIAGQGTIGLEIAEETHADVVLVPVGGGGLIGGIAARPRRSLHPCRSDRRRGGWLPATEFQPRRRCASAGQSVRSILSPTASPPDASDGCRSNSFMRTFIAPSPSTISRLARRSC